MPFAFRLYPTSDDNLFRTVKHSGQQDQIRLAKFLLEHRDKFQFRIATDNNIFNTGKKYNGNVSFYCNFDFAMFAIKTFWDDLYDVQSVDLDNVQLIDKNTVICKRLPHNKYEYQVHVNGYLHKKITTHERTALANLIYDNERVKIASHTLRDFLSGTKNYCWGGYFYIEDEKMLSAIYMVSKNIIDKVKRYVKA
jgi:hypothetical protein|tara:strand:- start:870 stop:1454 length:585 start_codon:yes stop_codon:yes gene_type:complete